MRGALGFSVLRFWIFFWSVFRFLCQKTSVFRFWCSMRFADFSFFSIWFSVFVENTSGFSVLVPDVVFGFSYFFFLFGPIWVPLSLWLNGNWSRIAETPLNVIERNAWQTGCRGRGSRALNDNTIKYNSLFTFPRLWPRRPGRSFGQFASYGFQRASRASSGRSNCGLCCVFLRGGERRREFSKKKKSLDVKWKGKREACSSLRRVFGKSIESQQAIPFWPLFTLP